MLPKCSCICPRRCALQLHMICCAVPRIKLASSSSNTDSAQAAHLHHFADNASSSCGIMQNFLAAYRKSQASSNSDAFLCCRAKEFHAQARQENGAGIVLTAALDRKFRPFSPQRADEIPRAAAGTQRCSLLIALCTCPPGNRSCRFRARSATLRGRSAE